MQHFKIQALKRSFFLLILIVFSTTVKAQVRDKIFLEGEAVTKFSVGKETRNVLKYQENVTMHVPRRQRYDGPVLGINASINYRLINLLSVGIGGGINVVQDIHPFTAHQYRDRVMFPLFLKLGYENKISQNWTFLTDLNAGVQLHYYGYGYSLENDGYDFQERGGLLANIDLGIGRDIGKYTAFLKLGYEINEFRHEDSLGWLNFQDLSYEDKIEYKTYYQLLKVSFSIRL